MSRFSLEPFVAARHLSSPASSPRKALPSRLLATLDQEIEKIGLGKTNDATNSSDRYSNTMKIALSTSGDNVRRENRNGGSHISQTPVPPFFSNASNPVSASTPFYKNATSIHTVNGMTEVSTEYTTLTEGETAEESSPNFPLYTYKSTSPPPVRHYVRDEDEANKLASRLQGPLGFDLEWRVMFRPKMIERKTAVLQLADERIILILQLSAMKQVPRIVKEIMERQDVIKMGVNILNDGRKLQRDFGVVSAGLLEMSHLARLVDPSRVKSKRMISLQRIVEMYTGCTLSKGSVRTSNWEAKLNEEQLEYAANDAHSALKVHLELMRRAKAAGLHLKSVVTPGRSPMGITYVSESSDAVGHGFTPRILPHSSKPMGKGKSPAIANDSIVGDPPSFRVTSIDSAHAFKPRSKLEGQPLRAYKLWHDERLPLQDICGSLRSPEKPLQKGTVITYVVEALKADTSLPFSRERLKELVHLDTWSVKRHGWFLASLEKTDRGLE